MSFSSDNFVVVVLQCARLCVARTGDISRLPTLIFFVLCNSNVRERWRDMKATPTLESEWSISEASVVHLNWPAGYKRRLKLPGTGFLFRAISTAVNVTLTSVNEVWWADWFSLTKKCFTYRTSFRRSRRRSPSRRCRRGRARYSFRHRTLGSRLGTAARRWWAEASPCAPCSSTCSSSPHLSSRTSASQCRSTNRLDNEWLAGPKMNRTLFESKQQMFSWSVDAEAFHRLLMNSQSS